MNTKQILNLDYREPENQEIIQKVLRQIKPLSRFSEENDIPLSAIERAISVMCKKYNIRVSNIVSDVYGNDTFIIWSACIITEHNYKTAETVHGISMYELMSKAAIALYAEVKKGAKLRKE